MIVNLGAAVNVIHGIRTHHAQTTGCPTWDEAGIRATLTGCEGSPGSVLAAAALAAEDTNLRAPSVPALRHHWPVNATSTPPRHSLDVASCGPCTAAARAQNTRYNERKNAKRRIERASA